MKNLIKEFNYFNLKIDSAFKVPHFHAGYEIIYVVKGSVVIEINGFRHEVRAPSFILLNPFEWHKIIRSNDDYLRYTVVADSDTLEREVNPRIISSLKCRPTGFRHVIPLDGETTFYVDRFFSLIEKEFRNRNAYGEKLMANELYNLLIIIHRILQTDNQSFHENMMNVQLHIDEHYDGIENVESVAKQFFISPEYLSRAFKTYSGYTPIEYLINTRLFHAQILLTETTMSSSQICAKVGFRDVNHFTRQFRLKFGVPPMAFRKQQIAAAAAESSACEPRPEDSAKRARKNSDKKLSV